ncbi:MAG TPA: ABC transporter substrate-binding protein [Thermomicrobiaceae bacterium]|nr:ABC transporter substrate-binding protein [Thermomicrobiaceae bacterium]
MDDARVERLIAEATERRYSRRRILARAAELGIGGAALAAVLAACGSSSSNGTSSSGTTTSGGGAATGAASATQAAGQSTSAPSGQTGGIVNANTTLGDQGIGNPILTSNEYWTSWLCFNRLVKYDDKGNQIPDLAKSWKFSDDSLTLTLNLVDNAKWHDGQPFTAADALFTFDKVKDKNTKTPLASNLQVGDEFVDWSAPDDHTVVIKMKQPYAPFLYGLSQIPIIPKHILEKSADINTDPFNKQPIGTGPYKLTEWQSDQYIKYVRNDDYFMGKPAADGWTNYFMKDTDAGAAALDKGDLDMMFTPPEMQPRYQSNADFVLHNYVYFTPITLAFNHKHPILKDMTVRKAISMAIDKKSLSDTVTKGRGIVANNQYAKTGPLDKYNDYTNVDYQKEYPFDVAGAKKLLDDAGWAPGSDGIRAKDGQRMSFTMLTYSGFTEYMNDQAILQQALKEIGIEVKPSVVEYNTLQGMWHDSNENPDDRAMEVQEWPHPFEQDPDVYNELDSKNFPPGDNYEYFKNDDVDKLIEQGRSTVDPDARAEVYKKLDVARLKSLPALPLYCAVDGWVCSKRLGGIPADTPSFRWYQRAFPEKIYKISK